ncbi:winged helix-turn-helix transcriptional regulator [Allosphingosinicella indica]|uniref:Transcriptional regulator, HxlR family n=1 Tax=Allosphingosinicella indica TaxID=941907 RepID=A0A1X7GLF7_9SPHN|nr:helix-turn-helix domain-containing protein [Allosphingosinicella indica]SMF71072.1 transcriptional regulator, HxlR family [Allosphingosinicella indica]
MTAPTLIRTCSIWRALEIVGDTPTLLILEASWLGARRFDDFRRRTGLLKALLSDRLKRLVEAGVFEKRLYCEAPPRHVYAMTAKGRDVYWTALMLLRWEHRWGTPGKIDVALTHKSCGKAFEPTPACGHCGGEVDATRVDWQEGPGLGWMVPQYSRRRQQRDSSTDATSLMDQAAQLMGDRWASLIMRSIFTGVRRFDEIRRDTAIATNILSERLAWLTSIGVIRQEQYASSPPRYEYKLRRKGVDYYPALLMLMQWGDTYYVAPEGPPLLLKHKDCGKELIAKVVCSECRAPIEPEDVEFRVREERTTPVF